MICQHWEEVGELFAKAISQALINILISIFVENWIILLVNTWLTALTVCAFILAINEAIELVKKEKKKIL